MKRRILVTALALLVVLGGWRVVRHLLRARPPAPTEAQRALAGRVSILRDTLGVPHVFGDTDAATAFGLAYAHAEDDYGTIQGVAAAARGRLGWVLPQKTALLNDYYVALIGVGRDVERGYPELGADYRALVEGYAEGLNFYAAVHPDEVDARLLPYTGRDVAAGFVHKLPILLGFTSALGKVSEQPFEVGEPFGDDHAPGSNAHAVARARSDDDTTRLLINSHQPWAGPVAWYEAQVHSEEGLDMVGGLFPGSPVVLHGHNSKLGWAHTVNEPDIVDVYKLTMHPTLPLTYKWGDTWRPLDVENARLDFDTGWFILSISRPVYRSVHGPVLETDHGYYAIRNTAEGSALRAGEQWYQMGKANNLEEWRTAVSRNAIPMFHTVYADRDHIAYEYVARMPRRSADGGKVLSGDTLPEDLLPWSELPRVTDPESGWIQACNSAPSTATMGPEAPVGFTAGRGFEQHVTNRTRRTFELFAAGSISRASFLAMKWDRTYAADAPIFRELIEPLRAVVPVEDEKQAIDLLLAWDGTTSEDSVAAAIALLAWRPLASDGAHVKQPYDARSALGSALDVLRSTYGSIEVPLGRLQRLRRGEVDLPLGGGPDLLNAQYADLIDGTLVGDQGDSLVMLVEFAADGVRSFAVQPYGSATNRPDSPHYADQAQAFVQHELGPVWRTREELRAHLEREYHPGQ